MVAYEIIIISLYQVGSNTANVQSLIIETVSAGQNFAMFSTTGSWTSSSSHSTASGCTSGIGSIFTSLHSKGDVATFTPNFPNSGQYEVFVTTFNYGSADAPNTTVTVNSASGSQVLYRDITMANCGNKWYSLGTWNFNDNGTEYVKFDDSTCTKTGSVNEFRLNPAALRFVPALSSAGFEAKPVKTPAKESFTVGSHVIADNDSDLYIGYQDGTGWDISTYGTNYGDSKKYYNPSSGMNMYATWCWMCPIQLNGYYALSALSPMEITMHRLIRFVDRDGVVRNAPNPGYISSGA